MTQVSKVLATGKLITRRTEYVAIRLMPISRVKRHGFFTRLLRFSVFHPATWQQSLVRAATWRHKVTQEPRQPERGGGEEGKKEGGGEEEAFLETFWYTTKRGFYSLVARSQMGRRDIKTGCARAYSSRRNAVYIRSPYSRYIHVFSSSANFYSPPLTLRAITPPSACIFARMRFLSRSYFTKLTYSDRFANPIRYPHLSSHIIIWCANTSKCVYKIFIQTTSYYHIYITNYKFKLL